MKYIRTFNENTYNYSTLLVPFSEIPKEIISMWVEIREKIPSDNFHEEDKSLDLPHITVMYGFAKNTDFFCVKDDLRNFGSIKISIDDLSYFEVSDDYNVMTMSVSSDRLTFIHNSMKDRYETHHSYEYNPHLTVAYLNKDAPKIDDNMEHIFPIQFEIKKLFWSNKEGMKYIIPLC